jgi:hypothetical protein
MKKLLIPFLILTNTLFSQDTIKTKFTFDLTGSVSQANANKQDNILLSSFSSVGWKKFETDSETRTRATWLINLLFRREFEWC